MDLSVWEKTVRLAEEHVDNNTGKLNKFNFASKPTTDKAFTLVELIVLVSGIIGIVLVSAVPTTKNVFNRHLKKLPAS